MDSWRRADIPVLPGSGPAPRIHDTASGEMVLAAAGPVATLYACGITPYDATHIGHASTYNAWDLLVRAWLDARPETRDAAPDARYTVVYVQNVTDVDDPLLERAERDGEDWRELARREIQRYRGDMEALRILPPDHLIGAVEALPVIEQFTARLADRGALYDVDRGPLLRQVRRSALRRAVRAGHRQRVRPGRDGRPGRAARRRPGPAREEGPAGRPGLAGRTPRRASLGLAASAAVGRAGTSNAPPSRPSTWARSSTCKPADRTWSSRTTS